jgi:tetratricopeptide (TPR) repeat protein
VGATRNQISGSMANVVQASSIGTITFNEPQAPTAVPALVPVPPDSFTNRDDELAELRRLVSQPSVGRTRPIVVELGGMVGIGKSALLSQAASVLGDQYPDGQLHVRYGADSESPSETAARFLAALGVPDQYIPPTFDRRVDLYRSLTKDRRMITVFDDVSDAAQVVALLPTSPSSLVLVAGNQSLEDLYLDGAVALRLQPLSIEHGVEMLHKLCHDGRIEADREAAVELVELCGGLPLAVRVAGAWLAARPHWTVGRLVEDLREADEDHDFSSPDRSARAKVFSVFDLTYEQLSESAQRLYRLFGVLVGQHFKDEVLTAMTGLPRRQVAGDLDDLVKTGMVEADTAGNFRPHRLIRVHALRKSAELDSEQDRAEALHKAVNWWLTGAVAADVAVSGLRRLRIADPMELLETLPNITKKAAMNWLASELVNLLDIMRAAANHGWHDQTWQLFEALFTLFDARKPLAAWVRAGELAVDSAKASGNPLAEARCRCLLAKAYQELGRYADAHAQLDIARGLPVTERLEASIEDFTGNVLMREEDNEGALARFEIALAINERLEMVRGTALQSMLCGRVLGRLGRRDEAVAAFERARALITGTDAESLLPKLLVSLAAVQDDTTAESTLSEALELTESGGFLVVAAKACTALAELSGRRGDVEAELAYRNRSAEIIARMDNGTPRTARILVGLPAAA